MLMRQANSKAVDRDEARYDLVLRLLLWDELTDASSVVEATDSSSCSLASAPSFLLLFRGSAVTALYVLSACCCSARCHMSCRRWTKSAPFPTDRGRKMRVVCDSPTHGQARHQFRYSRASEHKHFKRRTVAKSMNWRCGPHRVSIRPSPGTNLPVRDSFVECPCFVLASSFLDAFSLSRISRRVSDFCQAAKKPECLVQ